LNDADRRILEAVFGNSPFLTRCALHEPAITLALLRDGPEAVLGGLIAETVAEAGETTEALMKRLRVIKRRVALAIGIADIAGQWDVERVVRALSDFAGRAVTAAVDGLIGAQAAAGALAVADSGDPSSDCGYVVLGMGKLGARELNYSSDIDLIVLYDPERAPYAGRRPVSEFFIRLTRDLVKVLQERTADGYVFRTDLRLRPDAGATPVAISIGGAEAYYESVGQNWERAAMIKARPIAGDLAVGRDFLDHIRPFVWRRHLDFAAVQDVHAMTRLIRSHHGFGRIAVGGHDIKLGIGGIREIEFFVQIHQLIAGGRRVPLREPTTLGVLGQLAADGVIATDDADALRAAYLFLRQLEHRLQMVHDEQTHTVPTADADLERIATFMGFDTRAAFEAVLLGYLGRVACAYDALLGTASAASQGVDDAGFDFEGDSAGMAEALLGLGFHDPQPVLEHVRRWIAGRYPALRNERARELLRKLVPAVLRAFGRSPEPEAALARFDAFLSGLPAGIQLFSLFNANPRLLDLLVEIMAGAATLAGALARSPSLLDAVLQPDFHTIPDDSDTLAGDLGEMLRGARDFEDVLNLTRRWTSERKFQVGVQLLLGEADGERAGLALTAVAEAVLGWLVPRVAAEFAEAHGAMPGGQLAILALGKLGAREMTLASDIDLVIVYDADPTAMSDGARPLGASDYYARLSKRIINAVTALTGEGRLYEVDMRLRPSGNQGPVAVSLAAFADYQREKAWTWERMALTRARVIFGPRDLAGRIDAVVRQTVTRPEDPAELAAAVADMRARMAAHDGPTDPWDVKSVRGGLIDLEFIAQFLILRHAERHPELIVGKTIEAFRRFRDAGTLDRSQAQDLVDAAHLLLNVQHLMRLWGREAFDEDSAPKALAERLAGLFGLPTLAAVRDALVAREGQVRAHFAAIVEREATRTEIASMANE
jgi:glutamate-ammonia-ligase adenylyltransferase